MWRRGSAPDHDCDNEILSWFLTSQKNLSCKQPQKRWMPSVSVITWKQNDESTSSRYRGGNVDTKPGSANLAGRLAVSSSQKTRSFIFCCLSRKERANSRKNSFSYIVALRFLLLVPRKRARGSWACLYIGRVARVAFDNHVRLQAGSNSRTWYRWPFIK